MKYATNTNPVTPAAGWAASAGHLSATVVYVDLSLEKDVPATPWHAWDAAASTGTPEAEIIVDPLQTHQPMAGVGAAFSEIGALAAMGLRPDTRSALVAGLFDPAGGAGLSLGRLPIGSSDFATGAYSYAERQDDWEMASFTIDRDRASLVPFAQSALAANPGLRLFASPWSPPGWMKESGTMDGGGELSRLRDDPRVRSAWAEYLVRYVLAYAGEGLPIARLSPQNEMDCNPTYPGCVMSPEQTIPLLVEHLAPRLRAAMPAVELWAGTFREGDKAPWAAACLRDPAFRKAIDGIAVQYFEHRHVAALTAAWPELRLMHSEADCRDGSNSAAQARLRLGEITGIINAGCDSFAYWNMLLDERQKSGWNWSQNSLATIDRGSGTVRYNPDWQPVALASRSIRAGDVRIAATALGDAGPVSGFARKDGSVTLLCGNRMSAARVLAVRVGARSMTLRLPPDSDCAITLAP